VSLKNPKPESQLRMLIDYFKQLKEFEELFFLFNMKVEHCLRLLGTCLVSLKLLGLFVKALKRQQKVGHC
jgi:hypothetical protein